MENENGILKSYENNEWQPISGKNSRIEQYAKYARETLRKDKRLNIRLSARDMEGLKRLAVREGIPYQTLISSILHKYVAAKSA
jgi:predicted DNA binding CopG/RHH family protein